MHICDKLVTGSVKSDLCYRSIISSYNLGGKKAKSVG